MPFLKIIYYGLLALCLITLFFKYKRIGKTHFWFLPLIILAIITQVVGDILEHKNIKHYFVFHIYQPIEFLLLSIYYSRLFRNIILKKTVLFTMVPFLGFHLVYYWSRFNNLDFTDFTIQAIIIFSWCMIYFIQLLRGEHNSILSKDADFWINSANILFYTGCVLVMGIAKFFLANDPELRSKLFQINNFLNIQLYLLYCIAFLCLGRLKKYSR